MARVVVHGEQVAAFLRSPEGDVGRLMISLATRVQDLAKAYVGYDARKPSGEEGGAHLRDTIVKRIVETPNGITVYVGSDHPIALLHHTGTRAHMIYPREPRTIGSDGKAHGGILAFEVDGHLVFATVVHHPGTKPNPYLTRPLEIVMNSV